MPVKSRRPRMWAEAEHYLSLARAVGQEHRPPSKLERHAATTFYLLRTLFVLYATALVRSCSHVPSADASSHPGTNVLNALYGGFHVGAPVDSAVQPHAMPCSASRYMAPPCPPHYSIILTVIHLRLAWISSHPVGRSALIWQVGYAAEEL